MISPIRKDDSKALEFKLDVALQYLAEVGDIVWFSEAFKDVLFVQRDIFMKVLTTIFDHDLEGKLKRFRKKKNDIVYNRDQIKQGIIFEKTFDVLFDPEFLKFQSDTRNPTSIVKIPGDIIKKLLIALKIIIPARIKIGPASDLNKDRSEPVFIIPSLVNTPISEYTKDKSTEEVLAQFQTEFQYTFVFGEDNCFASAGVIESFFVNLYTVYMEHITKQSDDFPEARCFRDTIECRIPGIVFAIEFFPSGEAKGDLISILEEERINNEKELKYYKDRLVHVFLRPGMNTEMHLRRINDAMSKAILATINDKTKAVKALGNAGFRCLTCIYPEGYVRGPFSDDESDCTWRCNKDSSHQLEFRKAVSDSTYNESQLHVIRCYTYSVSCFGTCH